MKPPKVGSTARLSSPKSELAEVRHLGVLTGGGDCPGLNAVIRAVVRAGRIEHGLRVTGIRDGFAGLIHGRYHALEEGVDELLFRGGTILGSSNRANPFAYSLVIEGERKAVDLSDTVVENFRREGFDGLVAIGGDGTIAISYELMRKGLPLVAVPKTIDNDLKCTDVTFGFDTAVGTATEAIDRIRTTAESHHRAMVVEVMGRNAGWIALLSGLAGGAHVILIPEIPFRMERVAEKVAERQRAGKAFIILVVAEGARELGGEQVVKRRVDDPSEPRRLGGIGNVVGEKLEQMTGIETRVTVLGHIQRGGTPSTFDRNLATRFGVHAVELAAAGRFGRMVALRAGQVTEVPLDEDVKGQRLVPLDSDYLRVARSLGTSFGD